MELSWTTFIVEIVNFLVLVWILKRFLYKPVLAAIGQRKAVIDQTLSDAKARQSDAQALEQQYSTRLADWQQEKQKLRAAVIGEIDAQREQLMTALESSLAQERERSRILEERQLNQLRKAAEEEGLARGVEFTARLLERCASPELEDKLVSLVIEDLPKLPNEQLQAIRAACGEANWRIKTTSAFTLSELQRKSIVQTLKDITQDNAAIEFHEDGRLLAGLRISLGPWMVRANLRDELGFFSGAMGHDSRNQ